MVAVVVEECRVPRLRVVAVSIDDRAHLACALLCVGRGRPRCTPQASCARRVPTRKRRARASAAAPRAFPYAGPPCERRRSTARACRAVAPARSIRASLPASRAEPTRSRPSRSPRGASGAGRPRRARSTGPYRWRPRVPGAGAAPSRAPPRCPPRGPRSGPRERAYCGRARSGPSPQLGRVSPPSPVGRPTERAAAGDLGDEVEAAS